MAMTRNHQPKPPTTNNGRRSPQGPLWVAIRAPQSKLNNFLRARFSTSGGESAVSLTLRNTSALKTFPEKKVLSDEVRETPQKLLLQFKNENDEESVRKKLYLHLTSTHTFQGLPVPGNTAICKDSQHLRGPNFTVTAQGPQSQQPQCISRTRRF